VTKQDETKLYKAACEYHAARSSYMEAVRKTNKAIAKLTGCLGDELSLGLLHNDLAKKGRKMMQASSEYLDLRDRLERE